MGGGLEAFIGNSNNAAPYTRSDGTCESAKGNQLAGEVLHLFLLTIAAIPHSCS
jgi:hypothetical protein